MLDSDVGDAICGADEAIIGAVETAVTVMLDAAAATDVDETISEAPDGATWTPEADDTATEAMAPSRRIAGDAAERILRRLCSTHCSARPAATQRLHGMCPTHFLWI